MSMDGERQDLIRVVVGRSCRVAMRSELVIRFGYGHVIPWVNRLEDGTLRAIAGPDQLALRTTAPLRGDDFKTISEFTVSDGETVPFVLSYATSHLPLPKPIDADATLAKTEAFWTEWAERCRYKGPWADAVVRSHLVLKALTYEPTGGIVAAPTTSLPELPGGPRNWDYRFCWLRDSTFSLLSPMNAGYFDGARAWRDWLLRAVAGSPSRIQIIYGLAGECDLTERELAWLPGYQRSLPVRIGNAAHRQLQLDVYGEVMDTFHHARRGGLEHSEAVGGSARSFRIWRRFGSGPTKASGNAQREPPLHALQSNGLGGVRPRHSQRRAVHLEAPLERWRGIRSQIHEEVCRRGFNAKIGSFVQCYGGKTLDASLLLIPLVGFLPAGDPRSHCRDRRAPADGRWLCPSLRFFGYRGCDCHPAKERFSLAVFGSPTI